MTPLLQTTPAKPYAGHLPKTLGALALLIALASFTVFTQDGGELAGRWVSGFLLSCGAVLFLSGRIELRWSIPAVCLLLMSLYGLVQTLWFPQKIAYNGAVATLWWFTATMTVLISSAVLADRSRSSLFRKAFVLFGSSMCVLDLLEQASRTNLYFWLVQSRYPHVYGPFAYWNNFAEFVEILLPVTLWFGMAGRKPDLRYLALAALQLGAVAASGSRAGSALVVLELITVLLLAFWRNRNQAFLYAAASTVLLSTLFVYAAGVSDVMQKLHQKDQLSVRRDINQSSLAMIRARPLTGWGLGSYVPVYRMFARFDDGSYVNRAHNDWLEWTAEGGIFFSGLMLASVLWSVRPALRSIWGIGLLAVCLHAFVDYPFARLGVCGWYFALLGLLAVPMKERKERVGPPGAVAPRSTLENL